MFEGLQENLGGIFRKLRGQTKLSPKNIKDALREVKKALLQADVNYRATQDFLKKIETRAVGQEVLKSLTPGQQFIKIVHEEMVALMGGKDSKPPQLPHGSRQEVLLMGLQGSGKTTTAAKLAYFYKNKGRRPLLVACDVYRPAAIRQLEILGEQVGVPVFSNHDEKNPVRIAQEALQYADREVLDLVIVDTAGRLHIDENMMDEVARLKKLVDPTWSLFVTDASGGQDATRQAQEFHEKVGMDGVILTKLDGDTRGGAALSIRYVTQKPIIFAGMGERFLDLDQFYPDRMAGRILGMGDVLSLIEKAEQNITEEKAKEIEQKMKKARFNFEDFLEQLQQVRKMGGLQTMLSHLPGFNNKALKGMDLDESGFKRTEAIVLSMTPGERRNPKLISGNRKRRIALGSGNSVQDVNRFIKKFDEMQKVLKQMSQKKGMFKNGGMPFGLG